jgi:hypothetical protein
MISVGPGSARTHTFAECRTAFNTLRECRASPTRSISRASAHVAAVAGGDILLLIEGLRRGEQSEARPEGELEGHKRKGGREGAEGGCSCPSRREYVLQDFPNLSAREIYPGSDACASGSGATRGAVVCAAGRLALALVSGPGAAGFFCSRVLSSSAPTNYWLA